jgi:hypothetical protein
VTGQQPALPAPPRHLPAAEEPAPKIALNTNERGLLTLIATKGVALTNESPLHPEQLRRAKAKLRTLGYLREERIISHDGRGGSAIALALTDTGHIAAGTTPGGLGGGGLQHQYLVRKLLERTNGSQREVSLGGKRVDILFTYTEEHEWLSTIDPLIALNTGDHVAIEVEVSDPTKTAPSNIEKNAAAGVRLTIVAVLPTQVEHTSEALRTQLTAELLATTTVVNVFHLIKDHA